MVKLPNLELLMYKAMLYFQQDKEFLEKRSELESHNHRTVTFDIETFSQTWGSTCTGFDVTEDGKATIGGCAMTTEYTTIQYFGFIYIPSTRNINRYKNAKAIKDVRMIIGYHTNDYKQ